MAAAFAAPMKVAFYEGGYSPDFGLGGNQHSPPVVAATNSTSAVLTLGKERGHQWDGVVNMRVTFMSAIGGSWSTVVGKTYTVTSIDALNHKITINLDSTSLGALVAPL